MRNARELYHHLRDTYGEEFVGTVYSFEDSLSANQVRSGPLDWPSTFAGATKTGGEYLARVGVPDASWDAWCARIENLCVHAGRRLLEKYAQE